MSLPAVPTQLQNKKFLLIANLKAAPGRAGEMKVHLFAIKAFAASSEPGTSLYRVTRGVGSDSDTFTVLEEYVPLFLDDFRLREMTSNKRRYADKTAFDLHGSSEVFKAFISSGIIAEITVNFREEI
ncbi:hypothetical protein V5O48_007772 [Marasmius crinis-equi]|uniref:Uncharacterized protein n=1 Tax=Marasmius crinis-equi TaxID=585013 RepID=A0ABR3FFQ0_9AGAR